MPNWCVNHMTVCGPENEVRTIANKVKTKDEDSNDGRLSSFMPQPTDAAGELIDGTNWQYDNWGTKWGDCETNLSDETYLSPNVSTASFDFLTPWGPASGLIKEISKLHPNVIIDIEYEEQGMNFFGIEQYKGGKLVHEVHHEYEFDSGVIALPDGWSANFDTDWDNVDQDPYSTLSDAVMSAIEHLWSARSLTAPIDSGLIES